MVPLEDFFIAYGKQDRAPGDFVESLRIPRREPGVHHAAYKISKRRDEDISSVCGGFALEVDGRQGDSGPARLRRHGGDAEARRTGRGGAGRAGLGRGGGGRCGGGAGGGFHADQRLAGLGGVPDGGGAEPAAAVPAGDGGRRRTPARLVRA